ncbi:MAG: ECF transporter S component [Defluviitaleaceae bacterium]|nr:ECF transporter S component [Defluviitaleaceae bacterium]
METNRTKKLTALAMLTSMAFVAGAMFRIRGAFPLAPFLTYDPKDVVILFGGFLFGPVAALLMSVTVALLDMVTVSESGPIGALMNTVASASFTCTAAIFYSKKRNITGAALGLAAGAIFATAVMLLWNYWIIPLYAPHITREAVISIMLPALLPFNLMKNGLNAFLAILLYKKVSGALKAAGLYKESEETKTSHTLQVVIMLTAAIAAVALIAAFFIMRGMS